MAKRIRKNNIEKMIKEGYGSGIGIEYKPWIKIQDVLSLGRVTRVKGLKTNRQHELLSDMERDYFYLLDYSDKVVDIREQYPLLPVEDTIIIADELGIKHPRNPNTGEYNVMTTDFLITISSGSGSEEVARTVKSKDDLLNKRVIEKFEIERIYWEKREISWGIVTELEIDKTIANNVSFIQAYRDISNIEYFRDIEIIDIKDLIYEFIKRLIGDSRSMRTICNEFDKELNLELGCGISIFRYLLINKIIEIDIKEKIDLNKNIPIIRVNDKEIWRVEAI